MTASNASALPRNPTWLERLRQDLGPTPGRLAATLRIVLATVIALVLLMVLQMPFASLGLYYIFLMSRESPATSLRAAIVALITFFLAIALELFVVIVSDNDPMVRLLSVVVASYGAGTLMAACTLPPLVSIWGFIYCTLIAFWERPAPADTVVKTSLYLVGTVALSALCGVVVEYLFASRNPADVLAGQMRMRFSAIDKVYTLFASGARPEELGPAIAALNRLAATGQGPMQDLYGQVVAHDLPRGSLPPGSRVRITMLAQLMDLAAAFASAHPAGVPEEMKERCAEIARHSHDVKTPDEMVLIHSAANPTLLDRVEVVLHLLHSMPADDSTDDEDLVALPANKVPFLIPGALTSKETAAFALKLTLCVFICYVFYFAVAWPGISTDVITVFIVALGNSGAIKQKLANRFVGSTIGGALAIGATVFLFPRMDTIFSLVLLIGVIAFIAAWWAGGRQFSYAGMQIAFSFYIVAFEGFSAPTELAPARDRLVGILVALLVVWIVFDQLWPVRTVTAMRGALAAIIRGEARLLRVFEDPAPHRVRMQRVDALRDQIGKTAMGLRTLNDTIVYEFGVDREAHGRVGDQILRTALLAVPFFWNQLAVLRSKQDEDFVTEPRLIQMRRRIAANLDSMAAAIVAEKPYIRIDEGPVAEESLLDDPRYGEYTRNTLASHQEMQAALVALRDHV